MLEEVPQPYRRLANGLLGQVLLKDLFDNSPDEVEKDKTVRETTLEWIAGPDSGLDVWARLGGLDPQLIREKAPTLTKEEVVAIRRLLAGKEESPND